MIAGGCISAFCNGYESKPTEEIFIACQRFLTKYSVRRGPLRPWLRQQSVADGFPPAFDRDLPSPASWPCDGSL